MTSRGAASRPLSTERLNSRSKQRINEAEILVTNASVDGVGNSEQTLKKSKRRSKRKHSSKQESRGTKNKGMEDGVQNVEFLQETELIPCVPIPNQNRKKSKKGVSFNVIPINSVIKTAKNKYKVLKKLGSGGCGETFVVENMISKKVLAVKAEFQKNPEKHLRREFDIYRLINFKKKENKNAMKHLLPILDFGECPDAIQFLFLPLCASSLEGLLKNGFPTLMTAFEVGIQTLESIHDLHLLGYIHRDIKPANFVINNHQTVVYVIDFGMSCRFITDPKKMPKSSVYNFIGTMHYAPRSAHKGLPQSRRDDIEAWLYVTLELFVPDILPWSTGKIQCNHFILMKEAFFKGHYNRRLEQAPPCFYTCTAVVKTLTPFDEPKYDRIIDKIKHEARQRQLKLRQKLAFNSTAFAMVVELAKTNALIMEAEKLEPSLDPENQKYARKSKSKVLMQTISQTEAKIATPISPIEEKALLASHTSWDHLTNTDKEFDVIGDDSVEIFKSSARCKVVKVSLKNKSKDDDEDNGNDS